MQHDRLDTSDAVGVTAEEELPVVFVPVAVVTSPGLG